jgi:hypothetical protein
LQIIGSVCHTNLQEFGVSPKQVCGNKDQFKASLSSQPHKGGVRNMSAYFSFDNAKISVVNKNV